MGMGLHLLHNYIHLYTIDLRYVCLMPDMLPCRHTDTR
jgi:hypothetical protein